MSTTEFSGRNWIKQSNGSVTALNDSGHVIGYTEYGGLGWSAFWYAHGERNRVFTDTPEAAAEALAAGIAEEAQS